MCLMIVLVSVIVIGGISISNISTMTSTANKNYENARLDGYNTEIKSQVQSVIAILQAEYDKSQNGDLTEDEAKKEAAEIVRNMRYRDDGSGYFYPGNISLYQTTGRFPGWKIITQIPPSQHTAKYISDLSLESALPNHSDEIVQESHLFPF